MSKEKLIKKPSGEGKPSILNTVLPYVVSAVLTFVFLLAVFKLDLNKILIPFQYSGDYLFTSSAVKGIIENGWYFNNPFLGTPTGQIMFDYPNSDVLNIILIKIITLFTHNWVLVINIYFLLTFFFTAFTSLYVFKKLGITTPVSIAGSLLYAFIPYHVMRGVGQLFLSAYFMIPLAVLVLLWLFEDIPPFYKKNKKGKIAFSLFEKRGLISTVTCLFISCSGVYYSFFVIFLMFIVSMILLVRKKKLKNIAVTICLIALIGLGVIANLSPSIYYQKNKGPNPITVRNAISSEIYGLKIIQMLLPIDTHRISKLNKFKEVYSESGFIINENRCASLGLYSSLGFIVLIFALLGGFGGLLLQNLSRLNASCLVLALVGGFSSIIAFIFPQIRAYNRISIIIAFFSLLAFLMFIDKAFVFLREKSLNKLAYSALLLILIFGIYDQTSREFIPNYEFNQKEYESDRSFVFNIEKSVPTGSKIFQLPYMYFPEHPGIVKLCDYQLFRGYLHSKNLFWSYGAIKGREGDLLLKRMSSLPVDVLLKEIAKKGFNGVYINRLGYEDSGAGLEKEIINVLGAQPLVSLNKNMVFFNMLDYNKKLK